MAMSDRARKRAAAAAIATAIAIPAEGLRQYAYDDTTGVLTVCYGSTTNVIAGRRYSIEECRQRLDADMQLAVIQVERCNPGLPDDVLAAFSDAVYNIGPRVACESTAHKHLLAGQYKQACLELTRWNRAGGIPLPGLTKRREKEKEICLRNL
jgi:GH24 family phage-related lysozyme (muramidase)